MKVAVEKSLSFIEKSFWESFTRVTHTIFFITKRIILYRIIARFQEIVSHWELCYSYDIFFVWGPSDANRGPRLWTWSNRSHRRMRIVNKPSYVNQFRKNKPSVTSCKSGQARLVTKTVARYMLLRCHIKSAAYNQHV